MNNYLRHFPEFESSDMPTFEGFEDTSWYNDSCPSFERKLKHGVAIRVWVSIKTLSNGTILKSDSLST
jgi:hypothetical protein